MKIFPLDNTEYSAAALGAWCATRTRGVFSGESHFSVIADGSMQLSVSPGLAWLKMSEFWGVCFLEEEATPLTLTPPTGFEAGTYGVCLRLGKTTNDGSIYIKATATAEELPEPIRNEFYDEIIVAYISVRRNQTSITQADIADKRLDESLCGIMRDGVTGIPTAQLQAQWMAWFDSIKDILDESTAGNLLALITALQDGTTPAGDAAKLGGQTPE
ncbi:MAG: hypothetical protein ACK5L3_05780 [Oscillospiraceae bacterium]